MHLMVSGGVSLAKPDVVVKPLFLEQVIAAKTWELCLSRSIVSLSGVGHQTCFRPPDKVTSWLSAM